jgi:hypothetical protein
MAQHGPTLSSSLIYLPYWKQKQAWDEEAEAFLERELKRQEKEQRKKQRELDRWLRTPEGEAWLTKCTAKAEQEALDREIAQREADYAKRKDAVLRQAIADGDVWPPEPPAKRLAQKPRQRTTPKMPALADFTTAAFGRQWYQEGDGRARVGRCVSKEEMEEVVAQWRAAWKAAPK